MKLMLKDFQEEAVEQMYSQVIDAKRRAAKGKLEVITLSAPTGSGKTVILTRLIELILEGDDEHSPDPGAVFLWLTDQPELNTQTRNKMVDASDILPWGRTVEINADFDQEAFSPGMVYFINTQKLGLNSSFIKKSDERNFSLWETINNTSESQPSRFFVIIDEAHRGTKLDSQNRAEASSVMQKFVLGSEEIGPVGLIVGISATLDKFTSLLESAAKAKKARAHQRVDIDPADVIASGLLKRKVILEHPDHQLAADFPLLRAGVRVWQDLTARWEVYCKSQQESQIVRPVLLIQVEDGTKSKTSNTDLQAVINAVRDEASEIAVSSFAHAFQEGTPLVLNDGTTIRYLAPSAIDTDPEVRVVLFKTSLNTGWDCPRAEVMVSFRTAKDATYIAQLVGRMVRTPLAREIEQDEVLNSVSLVLPQFDQRELNKVIKHLTDQSGDVPPTKIEDSRDRSILNRSPELIKCVDALTGIPTYIIPRKKVITEVQRLGILADALAYSGLRDGAGFEARERLVDLLQAHYLAYKDSEAYSSVVKLEGTIPVRSVALDYGSGSSEIAQEHEVPVSEEMIAELYEWSRKRLGLDLGLRYWKRRADHDESQNHALTKLELYALSADNAAIEKLRVGASEIVARWLNEYKVKVIKLPEAEKRIFDEVKQQVSKPTVDYLDFTNRLTLDWSSPAGSPTWHSHLYQNNHGLLPEKLSSWESKVLEEEMSEPDFLGFLRNRDRQPWSLCIPYEAGGIWKGCYPDFVVFRSKNEDVVVDIVDPHLISLEDAPQKAAALAKYADEHQDRFGRIDLIIVEQQGGIEKIKRLRLIDHNTRNRVMGVTTNQHLRHLFELST